jgi:hypothetical protein
MVFIRIFHEFVLFFEAFGPVLSHLRLLKIILFVDVSVSNDEFTHSAIKYKIKVLIIESF